MDYLIKKWYNQMNISMLKRMIRRYRNTLSLMKKYEPIVKENKYHTQITFTPHTNNLATYCKQLCDSHLKHIITFFSPETQNDVFITYGFARVLDDLVDDTDNPTIKQLALRQAQAILDMAYTLNPINQQNSFAFHLRRIAHKYQIPKELFQQLIDGIHMDISSDKRPLTQKQLNTYIERVSIVPGKIFTLLLREKSPIANCVTYHLFLTEQYADILLDLSKDTARGKLYLPKEVLEKHHIKHMTADNIHSFPTLKAVLGEIASKAMAHNETAIRLLKTHSLHNKDFYEFFATANKKMLLRVQKQVKAYMLNNASLQPSSTLSLIQSQRNRPYKEYRQIRTSPERSL